MTIIERFEACMAAEAPTGESAHTPAIAFLVAELGRLEARIAELEARPVVQRPEDIGIQSGEL